MAHAKLRDIAEAATRDPKKGLLDALGDISGLEVFHSLVMVATHIRPAVTAGGIHLPDRTLLEDRFQGKVGLVVKVGPLAFKDDELTRARFGGVQVRVGDWVFARPGDGFEMYSVDEKDGGTSCRIYDDTQIMGRVADPALVW
jgi:co-chaperonin GroES (HSP10)